MVKFAKKNIYLLSTILVILIGFLIRLKIFFDNPSFWFDESALGFNVLELKFKDLFGILHLQQIAPPLFLVTAKFLTCILGASDMSLRLFPFIIGNLCMVVFGLCLTSIFKNKFTILTGMLLFCLNVEMVKYSVEFKPYIVDTFATCLVLYIFTKINFNQSYIKIFILGAFLGILPWFSFVSAITISIAYVIIFSIKNYKKWFACFLPFFVSMILFIIYYLKVNNFYSEFMNDFFYNSFITFDVLISKIILALNFLFNLKLSILPLLLIFTGIIYGFFSKKSDFAFKFSLFNILGCITLSFLHKYPFFNRFVLYLYPLFLLLILYNFEKFYNFKNKFINFILVILISFLLIPSVGYAKSITFQKITKRDCARELMIDLSNKINPQDIITVDTLSTPDFLYYNKYFNLKNITNFNIDVKNGKLLYKRDKNIPLNIEKNKKYWFYSPWVSGLYTGLKPDYINICKEGGRIFYINGDKQ
ncbi:glycosyltransferase family 39 protein [bacterium]|nr:glycosyltransferase family 39 protein [bacterium]